MELKLYVDRLDDEALALLIRREQVQLLASDEHLGFRTVPEKLLDVAHLLLLSEMLVAV